MGPVTTQDADTCTPILLPLHQWTPDILSSHGLPAMESVFADFRTAGKGLPVGLSMMIEHWENKLVSSNPAKVLVSQGPEQQFDQIPALETIGRPGFERVIDIALYAPMFLETIEDVRWIKYGWPSSSFTSGSYMRTLWIFPQVSLLMDNIHEGFPEDADDLSHLAIALYQPPASSHGVFDLTARLDALLRRASTAAIPDLVSSWPEEISPGAIPFSPVKPSQLIRQ